MRNGWREVRLGRYRSDYGEENGQVARDDDGGSRKGIVAACAPVQVIGAMAK